MFYDRKCRWYQRAANLIIIRVREREREGEKKMWLAGGWWRVGGVVMYVCSSLVVRNGEEERQKKNLKIRKLEKL